MQLHRLGTKKLGGGGLREENCCTQESLQVRNGWEPLL